jgi:4-amino-4-deoxychorismate lyase
MSNLFLVRDGVLLTPDLQRCGVAGIMRSQVLERAGQISINSESCQLGMADLQAAEEVFICNSLIGIWPVISIDDRKYTRGTITSRLQDLLASGTDAGWQWQT